MIGFVDDLPYEPYDFIYVWKYLKDVIVYPSLSFQSGKTVLSNYLADATDISGREYRATQGVRYERP